MYLYFCCGGTCSSTPDRRSLPAYLGCHCDTWRRRCPASTTWRRRASGTSRVAPLMFRLGAPRRRILEASRTSGGTSPRRPAQTTHVKWVLNTKGLTTQGCRILTFIHCSAWRIASMCRATVAGSTRSSANSSSLPRVLVAASVIGAERIGSASWISGEGRPPPERVLAARRPLLFQSSRRLLLRPPPSARGLLR
jgi:hypothetical protein